MKDFRKLNVWNKSHRFTLAVYTMTKIFPREELFGVTSQLRRSASSIAANIAEGCGRGSDADFARHLQIAFGSACEVEYHLILAKDLCYMSEAKFHEAFDNLIELKKMLSSLMSRLRADRR
jgi:four helix bundle protein